MAKDYKMFPPSVNWDNINWDTRRPQMDFPVQVVYCSFFYNLTKRIVGNDELQCPRHTHCGVNANLHNHLLILRTNTSSLLMYPQLILHHWLQSAICSLEDVNIVAPGKVSLLVSY